MSLNIIREYPLNTWNPADSPDIMNGLEPVLEGGNVLYFPRLAFSLQGQEQDFLSERWSDGKAKNISLPNAGAEVRGAVGTPEQLQDLKAMMQRFADGAESLVKGLFPHYRQTLRRGATSFRTHPVEGRQTSWRKDDSRLHVDAFPSNPTGGARLMRVFTNLNPAGLPRVWRVGEPFRDYAINFLPRVKQPLPASAWLMKTLGITKSLRTEYDHVMLQLHDLGKSDLEYQRSSPQQEFPFPPGATWIVFSDQVLHAVMSGQFMLEQTFYLTANDLSAPDTAPLRVLEALLKRPLLG